MRYTDSRHDRLAARGRDRVASTVDALQSLSHVLWIGGPPGSGKTTVATRIARRHGLRWYGADTRTWAHRDRALDERNRAAERWEALTPSERWETATPDDMFAMSLHVERAAMIVDDLRRLPAAPMIVAEGTPVAPGLISAGIADGSRAVWLLPTAEFARARDLERRWPPGALELYRLVAERIQRDADEHGVTTLTIDGSLAIGETVAAVEDRFAAALATGARARTLAERRQLLREANASIAAQVRGYFARPWAEGDAESTERTFLCECGDPECTADVVVAVRRADAPVLAPGHAPGTVRGAVSEKRV
jgi:hypothetical protein